MVTLLAASGPWHLSWLEGHDPSFYVDIAIDTTVSQHAVESIDLDIDVIRRADGTVDVLDVDEFFERAEAMEYPADLVADAQRTADQLALLAKARERPFGAAPTDRWRGA